MVGIPNRPSRPNINQSNYRTLWHRDQILCAAVEYLWRGNQMHYDALTIAAIAAELQQTIEGGRVQQVLAVDENSIGMEIYAQRKRHYLMLNADPRSSRVHLVQEKLRRGVKKDSPLLLLLRKFVRGGQLTAIEQPDPTERLLILHFSHPEHGTTRLIAECITQRGNLILVNDDDLIMDCIRRSWASAGVERPLMPKQPYTPPPAQEKFAPIASARISSPLISTTQLSLVLQAGGALWRLLVNQFAGVSPTLAREVAWRVTGSIEGEANEADAAQIVQALAQIWRAIDTGEWQPGVWLKGESVAGFASYTVHGYEQWLPVDSMSAAVERYTSAPPASAQSAGPEAGASLEESAQDGYQVLRRTVANLLDQSERRLDRQLQALAKDEPESGEAEELRLQAEWLLALQSQIGPDQRTLEVDLGDRAIAIALATDKTAVQQAEQMFNRAAKLERAAQIIPERRAKLQEDLAYLQQLRLDLTQAENQPEIAAVQNELRLMGLLSTSNSRSPGASATQKPGGGNQPLRYFSDEGFQIVVGRNARQNEKVTFEIAKGEDLWLHARGAPGSHVVIRSGGQPVSDETLQMAAQLAAYHSKLVGEHAATVIVTPRRFVSRAPGGHPGQVLVRKEETITVPATLPIELME